MFNYGEKLSGRMYFPTYYVISPIRTTYIAFSAVYFWQTDKSLRRDRHLTNILRLMNIITGVKSLLTFETPTHQLNVHLCPRESLRVVFVTDDCDP